MDLLLPIIITTVILWVFLMIGLPIAQRITQDVSLPPFSETAWKLAVVAIACSVSFILLGHVYWIVSWGGTFLVFWVLVWKFFQAGFRAAVIVYVVTFFLNMITNMLILGWMLNHRGS
jgi:hypothetical protein